MKERIRHIAIGSVATILGGALFAFLVWKTGPILILENLRAFGLGAFVVFLGISVLNFALYTLRWKIILEEMEKKKKVRFVKLFFHRMSGFATGYLTPGAQVAGEPVRVALLATEGVSAQTATSSVILDLAFEIAAFLLYVATGMVLALSTGMGMGLFGQITYIALGVLVGIMMLFFISVVKGWNVFHIFFRRQFFHKHPKIQQFAEWILGVEEMMTHFFAGRAKVLLAVIALSLIMTGFRAVEAWFIASAFGENLTLSHAILLSTIPGLALLAPVPGGLGLLEASTSAMLAALGLRTPGVAFTLIIRLRDFLFIAVGAFHGIRAGVGWIGRRKKEKLVA